MNRLDGTGVCHPATFDYPQFRPELEEFNRRAGAAAIGSSDFHGPGRLGMLSQTLGIARFALLVITSPRRHGATED
jgi:hypothetical protein